VIYNLPIILLLVFELQKIIQFKRFFKLRSISSDYYLTIHTKNNVVSKALERLSIVDIIYLIVVFFGLFTVNRIFFTAIILISIIQHIIFSVTKKQTYRKVTFMIELLLSVILLLLIIINNYMYHLDGFGLIKEFFK